MCQKEFKKTKFKTNRLTTSKTIIYHLNFKFGQFVTNLWFHCIVCQKKYRECIFCPGLGNSWKENIGWMIGLIGLMDQLDFEQMDRLEFHRWGQKSFEMSPIGSLHFRCSGCSNLQLLSKKSEKSLNELSYVRLG